MKKLLHNISNFVKKLAASLRAIVQKLDKRTKILLIVFLFSLAVVSTLLIMSSIANRRNLDQQVGLVDEIVDEPEVEPEEPEIEEVEEEPEPEEPVIAFHFPESGVRPIAVTIDNEGKKVLPQGGIGQAQIIYELLTEYGITRYIAFFWGDLPDMIGPVRSIRHYFLDYVMEYDAIFAHIGWSHYAFHDLKTFSIDNIDGVLAGSNAYWDITNDPRNYQDSYTSPQRLNKHIEDRKIRRDTDSKLHFAYHDTDTDLASEMEAKEVFIRYNSNNHCGYYYDAETKNYRRTRMGEFHIDRNTEDTIRVKNIIIQYVKNENISGDTHGRQELTTTGSGKGYYITNGLAQEITWRKSARTSQTEYRNAKGEKILLNPGQTWIQIVPLNATIRIE